MKLTVKSAIPDKSIGHFVHSFWMLENKTGRDIPSTVLPNGMVDLLLTKGTSANWEMVLRGIDTIPSQVSILAGAKMFSIGLKLLAVEYLLGESIRDVLNVGRKFESNFWTFEGKSMTFKSFCDQATKKIASVPLNVIDSRKRELFELLYASNGSVTVSELAEKSHWSSRQINRYFNQQFGVSLKTYCNILRFGASFKHLSEGKLFPEQNLTDQNHFIKEIKKYAGVTPKVLSKNKDDQFINITAIKNFPS